MTINKTDIGKPDIDQLNKDFESLNLEQALKKVAEVFKGKQVSLSSSLGPEDQVITDGIFRNDLPFDVFTLDTGRLFSESYDVLDETTRKYNKKIAAYYPRNEPLEEFVLHNGINAIYDSIKQRKDCCYIRKIEPLNRALETVDVWITGLRGAQSAYRSEMNFFEIDHERNLIKFNPLLNWSTDEIWYYINQHEVPFNALHKKGFPSIGCQPCTRAIGLHEDERSGRWWWEDADKKECGLHTSQKKLA